MNDVERWIYLDGPQPGIVRELLGVEPDTGPETPEDEARLERAILARIGASAAVVAEDDSDEGAGHDGAAGGPQPRAGRAGAERHDDDGGSLPIPPGPAAPLETVLAAGPSGRHAPAYRPPASLAATAGALDVPPEIWRERGKLPFLPPDQVPAQKRAARTLEVPVMRAPSGETFPLGDETITKIVAALPFAGAGVTATVDVRDMKLETYTSLCAELSVRPHAVDAILIRYKVPSRVSLHVLHEHWRSRLAACPQERATFEDLLPRYMDYVRSWPW